MSTKGEPGFGEGPKDRPNSLAIKGLVIRGSGILFVITRTSLHRALLIRGFILLLFKFWKLFPSICCLLTCSRELVITGHFQKLKEPNNQITQHFFYLSI